MEALAGAFALVPEFVPLFVYPAVLLLVAVLMTALGGRRAYPYAAFALIAGAFAMCAARDLAGAFVFAGVFTAFAALLRLLFFLPLPKKGEKKRDRDEEMYEKFRAPLDGGIPNEPPKVERFDAELFTAEESGIELRHAEELLAKLKKLPLSATDRLEAEVIGRSVAAYSEKPLSEEERRTLNDCLAAILKLTAKYKL